MQRAYEGRYVINHALCQQLAPPDHAAAPWSHWKDPQHSNQQQRQTDLRAPPLLPEVLLLLLLNLQDLVAKELLLFLLVPVLPQLPVRDPLLHLVQRLRPHLGGCCGPQLLPCCLMLHEEHDLYVPCR